MKRKPSDKTCPKCKSRASKIFHLNTSKYECQICGHQYEPQGTPAYVAFLTSE